MAKTTGFDLELSGKLVSSLSFVLGSFGIYKVTELIFQNRSMALLSVIFFISNRELLDRSVDCLKESMLVCLVVWGNYLILKGIYSERRVWYFILGTFVFLAGAMVRGTALIFWGSWLIIWVFHKRERLFLRFMILLIPLSCVLMLGYFMPQLPFFRRSLSVAKLLSHGKTAWNSLMILNASLDFLRQFLARSFYFVALFALLGILFLKRNIVAIHVCIVVFIFFIICIKIGWNYTGSDSDRYILTPIIWLMPLAAYAVVTSLSSSTRIWNVLALLAIIAAPLLWADLALTPPDPDRLARKEAGIWLLSQVGPKKDIVSNEIRINFYAQGNILYLLPFSSLDKMQRVIAKKSPEGTMIVLSDVIDRNLLKMPIAIDINHEDGEPLKDLLDKKGIRPDRVFRSIYVYVPPRAIPLGQISHG
jgi:hypothetical protein